MSDTAQIVGVIVINLCLFVAGLMNKTKRDWQRYFLVVALIGAMAVY